MDNVGQEEVCLEGCEASVDEDDFMESDHRFGQQVGAYAGDIVTTQVESLQPEIFAVCDEAEEVTNLVRS